MADFTITSAELDEAGIDLDFINSIFKARGHANGLKDYLLDNELPSMQIDTIKQTVTTEATTENIASAKSIIDAQVAAAIEAEK